MACPNRDDDLRIIAEVERRKLATPAPKAEDEIVDQIVFDSTLQEVVFSGIEEEAIAKIERTDEGWKVTLKR